jgi:hypothetical protein
MRTVKRKVRVPPLPDRVQSASIEQGQNSILPTAPMRRNPDIAAERAGIIAPLVYGREPSSVFDAS